ncbi:hypothetical protein FXO38_02561 [Capsicum annuum]|uniref:Retrovirus-related Pol polyprotein from transposon TNT 1-94 n=1 Tax=Capsicum annuum TaxID=4072 RepID=A0A2G2YU95_CAPAN|nr:hypothetical protein FXO38_02561 [Capsicum annuum]KAF3682044.1 hypothetical protein FXO37_02570 [Capsicum annuum]PHT73274.1 hypothetical protein T459_24059 [Capsicum annuum]
MKVPKQFWSDAVSSTCFLINRMPSTVLNGDIPYGVLFPNKPLFPLEPTVFRSRCYSHDVKCVLLGYFHLYEDYYQCCSPTLNRYVVSKDVVFSDDMSFFSSPNISPSKGEEEEWIIYEITPPSSELHDKVPPSASFEQSTKNMSSDVAPAPTKLPSVKVYSN